MTWARIFSIVFSGFMVKLYAAAMAVYVASEAASFVTTAFDQVSQGFGQ